MVSAETLRNILEQFTCIKAQFRKQGTVPAKTYRSMVERFVRVRAQLREAHEEQHQEREARSAWETQASSWHTTLLAMDRVVLILVICCGLRLRGLWTSYTEASTHSDTWHGEQDSDQVGMESDSGQEDVWPPHSVWCPVATVLRSWTPKEGWEDMDGSPASVERALQALAEQLPEEEKATAGRVGWMFLTALSLNTENALNEMAQVPDQVSRLEALEARVCLLEAEPHSGDSEAEAEEVSGDNVAPNPQARPILKQRVKREQTLGPRVVAAGNPAVTELTTYTPYTPTELQELRRPYGQSQECSFQALGLT
ncbi:hypothetical protein mRhiFer1_007890 [Rhinolophus ferrumequinum]|uniref:Uncharacterized protein n=1 Tax=Rhinolophus ferrumequinum TaxID=59479 RepID=A0A7J8AVU3_RHIFE|nr:hypothetical protein mRhiFer1_007890 [Rhinolophus ferrumequinum]